MNSFFGTLLFVTVFSGVPYALGIYLGGLNKCSNVDLVKICMEASEKEIMDYDKCMVEVRKKYLCQL
jgi:hypothetical protein